MKKEIIENLIQTYSNDLELGEKIREYYFETRNNSDSFENQSIYNKNTTWTNWLKNKFWKT